MAKAQTAQTSSPPRPRGKYMIHTSNYRQGSTPRIGMPIEKEIDSPTMQELRKLELNNELRNHPEYGKVFPERAIPTVEGLLYKLPAINTKVRREMREAAEAAGRVADQQGRFYPDDAETAFEILEILSKLDESLALNFPWGSECYLDRACPLPKDFKDRAMTIRNNAKAKKDAREGRNLGKAEFRDEWA